MKTTVKPKNATAEVNAMIQELTQIARDLRQANAQLTKMAEDLAAQKEHKPRQ